MKGYSRDFSLGQETTKECLLISSYYIKAKNSHELNILIF